MISTVVSLPVSDSSLSPLQFSEYYVRSCHCFLLHYPALPSHWYPKSLKWPLQTLHNWAHISLLKPRDVLVSWTYQAHSCVKAKCQMYYSFVWILYFPLMSSWLTPLPSNLYSNDVFSERPLLTTLFKNSNLASPVNTPYHRLFP